MQFVFINESPFYKIAQMSDTECKYLLTITYRVFYCIENDFIFILRIIAKKDADKIFKALKNSEFPPDILQ
jgi:hypothetical protein